MIGRRAAAAGIGTKVGNHSFRATGITAYLKNSGTPKCCENAEPYGSVVISVGLIAFSHGPGGF